LVFDEPTSALDLVNQHDTVDLLRRLSHENGYTIIFSSHDPSHALHISDDCLLMNRIEGYLFGASESVITEKELRRVFGVDSQILCYQDGENGTSMGVLPILKPFVRKREVPA
jgi:iron complex transport system ATP-binding protein